MLNPTGQCVCYVKDTVHTQYKIYSEVAKKVEVQIQSHSREWENFSGTGIHIEKF